jgi:hypothetical protein
MQPRLGRVRWSFRPRSGGHRRFAIPPLCSPADDHQDPLSGRRRTRCGGDVGGIVIGTGAPPFRSCPVAQSPTSPPSGPPLASASRLRAPRCPSTLTAKC